MRMSQIQNITLNRLEWNGMGAAHARWKELHACITLQINELAHASVKRCVERFLNRHNLNLSLDEEVHPLNSIYVA